MKINEISKLTLTVKFKLKTESPQTKNSIQTTQERLMKCTKKLTIFNQNEPFCSLVRPLVELSRNQ